MCVCMYKGDFETDMRMKRGDALAEASWIEQGPAVGRHGVGLPGCRVQELFECLESSRELSVLLCDLPVSPLEEVDVLGCFGKDRPLSFC